MCDHGCAPKQQQTPEYAGVANYGYHLNAGKFSALLQRHCIEKLGVQHISDDVIKVNGELEENMTSVTTKKNGDISAQLFIDCSGSKSILLGQHYLLSKRTDSQYWLDNQSTESVPERLQELIKLWRFQAPSYNDFSEIEEIFPAASYQYILYGMGFITEKRSTSTLYDNTALAEKYAVENKQLCEKYLAGLPKNRQLINHILARGNNNNVRST